MMEIVVFSGGVLFISFFISLYIRSIAKEFFRLKRVVDENKDAMIEYAKQFVYINKESEENKTDKESDDVAYMKAYA